MTKQSINKAISFAGDMKSMMLIFSAILLWLKSRLSVKQLFVSDIVHGNSTTVNYSFISFLTNESLHCYSKYIVDKVK